MQSFDQSHTNDILSSFEDYASGYGFRKKRKGKFVREADDDLIHSINVHFGKRYGELKVTPFLAVLHYGIGPLITEALAPHTVIKDRRPRELDATLNLQPVKFILARREGTGAIVHYTIPQPALIQQWISQIFSAMDSVLDDFFSSQNNLSRVIEHFENDSWAGGVANRLKLLALYYYSGRFEDLRSVASEISPENSAPITVSMKHYLLRKIGDEFPDTPLAELKKQPDIPQGPRKLTREERRVAKQRNTEFKRALKAIARENGWRFARGSIFKQDGDWFLSNLPSLARERGVIVRLRCKPMAIDPLFWEIIGLDEANKKRLSFRNSGAAVLRPKWHELFIDSEETDPEVLAESVLKWSEEWRQSQLPSWSVENMLSEMGDLNELRGQDRSIAVCLAILTEDLDTAARLCRVEDDTTRSVLREAGGFTTTGRDGKSVNFLEQARDWIAKQRRNAIKLV